jgi:hypothetical protein
MTTFLEQVLAEVRELSDAEQDGVAAEPMAYLGAGEDDRDPQSSDEQIAEVRRRRADPFPGTMTIEEAESTRSYGFAAHLPAPGRSPRFQFLTRHHPAFFWGRQLAVSKKLFGQGDRG